MTVMVRCETRQCQAIDMRMPASRTTHPRNGSRGERVETFRFQLRAQACRPPLAANVGDGPTRRNALYQRASRPTRAAAPVP